MPLVPTLRVDARSDGVTFAVSTTNEDVEPEALRFPTAQTVGVVVTDGDREVWRYGEGRAFTQAVREETLEPGETATHEVTWDDPEPGTYEAEAWLLARPDARARATFEV